MVVVPMIVPVPVIVRAVDALHMMMVAHLGLADRVLEADHLLAVFTQGEIGRASCRERV